MKKSNKVSVFYIISSVCLFLVLVFGGVYGIYVSAGINFVGSTINNVGQGAGTASNVAIGGTVASKPSMSGIIILSIVLIVIAVFDLIALIKQIVFFKQFKAIKESAIEQKIERKVKSKGSVVAFAVIIDVASIAAGVFGVFLNMRSFVRNGILWILYLIDGVIIFLAVVSFVLLIAKLKHVKHLKSSNNDVFKNKYDKNVSNNQKCSETKQEKLDIDDVEYKLIKLKIMKSAKLINEEEFKQLRQKIIPTKRNRVSNK